MAMTAQELFAEFLRAHPELSVQDSRSIKQEEDFHGRRIVNTPHHEFPKMMYCPDGGKPKIAADAREKEKMEKKGWQARPFTGHIPTGDGTYIVPKAEVVEKAN